MNVDILTIHHEIIEYLQHPREDLLERQRLKELKTEFANTKDKLSSSVVSNLQKEIDVMEIHFRQMEDSSLLNFYLLFAVPIIEAYKKACTKPVQVSFMARQNSEMRERQQEKEGLIERYIFLTHRFFHRFPSLKHILENLVQYHPHECEGGARGGDGGVGYTTTTSSSCTPSKGRQSNDNKSSPADRCVLVCDQCQNTKDFEMYDNQSVCKECGTVLDQFQNNVLSFKDIERVNISSKYTYDRRTHFRDCFYQFQGKQNVTIPPSLYEEITHQLLAHGIIPTNYQDLPKEMAFERVEKEHINIFLKDSKFVKHYEDAVLIYHTLTGKPVPDLSYLEEDLMTDFDVLVDRYDKKYKHNTDRKNFINTQYVLFQLLRRHKYPCQKEDFNILKTIDRKYYHDEICSELFAELGWNFQPLF